VMGVNFGRQEILLDDNVSVGRPLPLVCFVVAQLVGSSIDSITWCV
jgi:hypothetical protein